MRYLYKVNVTHLLTNKKTGERYCHATEMYLNTIDCSPPASQVKQTLLWTSSCSFGQLIFYPKTCYEKAKKKKTRVVSHLGYPFGYLWMPCEGIVEVPEDGSSPNLGLKWRYH